MRGGSNLDSRLTWRRPPTRSASSSSPSSSRKDHLRLPSFPLVPPPEDTSTLLIIAGMQPLKPYLSGREKPPHLRLTDAQKVFRTPDIEEVGTTSRHLTFFEMMGNFSVGDYFKEGAARFAWDLSLEGFGLNADDIWVTVFEGDDALGIGPDQEAIDVWLEIGVPRERIVLCNRKENFWESGPTGLCGPCSELYLDRGLEFGKADDLPGGDNERFMEYWNLVFMQYDQQPRNTLTPLPAKNIDTGLGLERLVSLLQGVPSVFETDAFRPLVGLGEDLSGLKYGTDFRTDRALRILADHARGMSFLLADGVVPSNEGRGYPLRRIMRRAIVQGRRIGIEGAVLTPFAARVRDVMGSAYPELAREAETIEMWLGREEEQFSKTIEQGTRILNEHIERAKERGPGGHRLGRRVPAPRHLRLPVRADRRAGGRAGHGRRRGRLRAGDGARPRTVRGRPPAGRATRAATRSRSSRAARTSPPPSRATRRPSSRPRSARSRSRTAACSPSSSSRRSTRPAAARSPTAA